MPTHLELSLGVPTFGVPADGSWRHLLDLARAADAAGVSRLVLPDHVVLGPDTASYPWGRFPTDATADWLEPLTTISALAAVTEQVRFQTGILVAGLRPAALLAKTVATLDVLSEGRIDLGVGVGWQRAEFDAVGASFADRGPLLDETIAACRTLWSGEPLAVTGAEGEQTPVWCAPLPRQAPLPVWFSGTLNARNVRRIATLGDGWIPIMGATVADLASGVTVLRQALADAGRNPDHLQVRASAPVVRSADGTADLGATLEVAGALAEAGATDLHLPLRAFVADATSLPSAAAAVARVAAAFHDLGPLSTLRPPEG